MVKLVQNANIVYPRNALNTYQYLIPFDFATTGYIQVLFTDRQYSTKWTLLVENIDYMVKLDIGQWYVELIDPDSLTDFNFLRIKRIRPVSQPDIYPNTYSGPALEGKADNTMEIIQQINSTVDLLWDRPPLDIVDPNAEVGRFTLINNLDPNRLSGSSLKEENGAVKSDIDVVVDGALTVRDDCNVGNNITATYNISAGNNISATQNLTAGNNLAVGNDASVTGSITGANLTVSMNANLNYVYANSAVVTVIETNDILSNKGTISILETTTHTSNDIGTDKLTVVTTFTIPSTCEFASNGERFGWYMDFTDPTKTNLIIETVNGKTVIKNDVMPSGGGLGNVNLTDNYIPKGDATDGLVDSSIIDDGTKVTIGNDCFTTRLSVSNYFSMLFGSSMVASGAVFQFKFVGDFENKPYLAFSRSIEGQLEVTNTALPGVDVSSKYDSSGVLSGFAGSIGTGQITIASGTGVVWDGSTYQEISTSAPIVLPVSTLVDSYVFLRYDGAGGLEAHYQSTPPTKTQYVQEIYLYFVPVNNNAIVNIFNRYRNLNQQLEQVIDMFGLAVPYSDMTITLNYGFDTFIRNSGNFKSFGIKNIPSSGAKYDTSTIYSITDNAPVFTMLDIYRGNISSNITSFILPPSYLDNSVLTEIPADSWGYYQIAVNAYGQAIIIYPNEVFVSTEPSPVDAQTSLNTLAGIRNLKLDGLATIGSIGVKGGSTTFESGTAIYYRNYASLGDSTTVIQSGLPDPSNYAAGDRLTVIDIGGGVKEWEGAADSVKTASIGQDAYYDTTNTISGRNSRVGTGTPGYYAVYDSTGVALEGSPGPSFTSNVKPSTTGQAAYYDSDTTVSGTDDKLVPDPIAGDVNKVLGATGVGTIGWVDQSTGGESGTVTPGTAGNPAVYSGETTISESLDLLVKSPTANDIGQVWMAVQDGAAAWRSVSSTVDIITVSKIASETQQAGDVLTTLSKKRIFNNGSRIYDNYSRREILALNGQTISLKQYLGLGLKADIVDATPQPGDEPPEPIQCTGIESTVYRNVRFFRTPTNKRYVIEVIGPTYNGALSAIHLGTINPNTGVITRIREHTSWSGSGSATDPHMSGIFFVVDVLNNYYAFSVYNSVGSAHHIYFYNLTTGEAATPITTNKWNFSSNGADYGIFNGHLYVFYSGTTVLLDKMLITAGVTGEPNITYKINAESIASRSSSSSYKIKKIDDNTLIVLFTWFSTNYYFYHVIYDLSNDTYSQMYQRTAVGTGSTFFPTQGSIYYNGRFYWAYSGTTTNGILRGWLEIGTVNGQNEVAFPGNSTGTSYYDQHPKYTNLCALLKNNKSQLFLSYDYGETWIEKAGFDAATNFWPTDANATTTGNSFYRNLSRTIWLDDNNASMIFTGWLLDGGTDAPCAIQSLGNLPDEATLPVWYDGCYLISTEYQYMPVTWFNDIGTKSVIGESLHSRKLPLAKAITGDGEISSINWAAGTTPATNIVGFACSASTIGSWAASDKKVYFAADGFSFGEVYTTGENILITHIAHYDKTRAIIAAHQVSPYNATTIALVDTDGNVQVVYNVTSSYPIISDMAISDYFIVCSKEGVSQVLWADRQDLIFGSFTVGSQIKRVTTAGMTTHGLSLDGTTIYQWTGKGESETVVRTFSGTTINDIAADQGKLFAVGETGVDGSAFVYNYSDWTDYLSIGTSNKFNVVEISPTSVSDLIIAGENGFFQSSDGFATEPVSMSVGTGTYPTGIHSMAIDTTGIFTILFMVDGSNQGFNYRAGDLWTTIITDLIEHKTSGVIMGTTPIGYMVKKNPQDDFWTRQVIELIPGSTYTHRQTLAEGLNGVFYIQDTEGHIGVSTDDGETFTVAAASPIGRDRAGGAFVGGLLGNTSLLCISNGEILKSQDDWETAVTISPFNPDQYCTCFSRDLSRNDLLYAAVSQMETGSNICRIERFNASNGWVTPTMLLDVTLDQGRYFLRVASYNDRIVVSQSDGAIRYSTDAGLTWSGEDTSIIINPGQTEIIHSLWIDNTTDCVYVAKTGGVYYNTFNGLLNAEPWIKEDVPVSEDQVLGAHIIDKKRTVGIVGNVGVGMYWRKYDT